MRSAIEKFFGWIKYFRKIIIRYERLAITYKAFIIIARIIIHLIWNLEMSSKRIAFIINILVRIRIY